MNDKRLYSIILGPLTTEKSVGATDGNQQMVFRVAKNASKTEITTAIKKLFSVDVKSVRTLNVKGKKKQFKQMQGQRSDWKKAYVCLSEGQAINLADFQ